MADENGSQDTTDDDWGAAIAEQAQAEQAAMQAKQASATVFQEFSGAAGV